MTGSGSSSSTLHSPLPEAAYLKAIEIDPRHVNSHFALGVLLGWERGDWAGAENEFLRVLEIDPAHALAKKLLPVVRENMRK